MKTDEASHTGCMRSLVLSGMVRAAQSIMMAFTASAVVVLGNSS